jgi:hypothetical protein
MILERLRPKWAPVLDAPEAVRLQICFTPLMRDGRVVSEPTESFRTDAEYFYPASTVKLLAAVCVLRRVRELRQQGGPWSGFTLDTPLAYFPENAEPITRDETNREGGALTLRHCIRRALIVSENPPHNRLYEFLGHTGINEELVRLGFTGGVVNHRLDDVRSPEEQRTTPRIVATLEDGTRLEIPKRVGTPPGHPQEISRTHVGHGFWRDGVLNEGPLDFAAPGAEKNRVRLADLHALICRLLPRDPDAAHAVAATDLGLTPQDLSFLHRCMTVLPRESRNPIYDPTNFPDDYVKPMLNGLLALEPRARVINKLGWAYGFVTDAAVVEAPGCVAFGLSFTMWACAKGILGNDDYEYESLAKPFASDLAREALLAVRDGTR